MPTDQGPKLGFKATYPEGWEKRKTMTQKEKTEYFNKWASKLQLWITILKILQTMKPIPNKRRSTEEGHLAALIRRKMIERNHGDKKKFSRNELKREDRKGPHYILA